MKDARSIVGPDALIGVSAHSLEQARQAVLDGANYLGVGPTFPSGTKRFEHFPGVELLRRWPPRSAAGLCHRRHYAGEPGSGKISRIPARCRQRGGPWGRRSRPGRRRTQSRSFDRKMMPCPTKLNSNSPCPIYRPFPGNWPIRPFPSLPAQEEIDLYFAHPSRDFAATDEALRLRRKGDANYITYKGPKIDATTKTRREIELPLGPGPESLASWTALLEAVGFRPVGEVRKSRRKAAIPWQGRQVEASLDDVDGVGTFVEFELVAEESEVDAAKACIQSLAQSFGLTARRTAKLSGTLAERKVIMYLGIEIGGTKLQLAVGPGDGSPFVDFKRAEIRLEDGAGGILRQIDVDRPRTDRAPPATGHRHRLWRAGRCGGRADDHQPSGRRLDRLRPGRLVPRDVGTAGSGSPTMPMPPVWPRPSSERAAAIASSSISTSAAASAGPW